MNTEKNCTGCPRREFLKTLAALTGAGAVGGSFAAPLPAAVPAERIPDKKGALKVRVVFAFNTKEEVQTSPDWPNRGFDFRPVMKNMVDALNAGVKDVEFVVGKAATEEDGRRIAEADRASGDIVGYVVVQLNPWQRAVFGLVPSGLPVLYTSLPYAGDGGWLLYDSTFRRKGVRGYESICSFDFGHVVAVAGAFAKLRGGTPDDFAAAARATRLSLTPAPSGRRVRNDDLRCLGPAETLAKVKGLKLLVLGNGWGDDEAAMARDFGVVIEHCEFGELNDFWEKVTEARARPLLDDWKRTALDIVDVSDDVLLGVARMYFAMEDLLRAHGATALTIDCLGACYSGKLKAYPCLGFMELQDRGLMGTCESDTASLLTMLVFGAMTGRVGYISDPALDAGTRSIVYAHCVSTRRFFGKDGPMAAYEIHTHSEDREGASVRALGPVGFPVTTVKIVAAKRIIGLHTGVTTGNDPDSRACRTKIVAEIPGDYEKLSRSWDILDWHRVTFYGDFAPAVKALAEKLGYEVVLES